MAILKMKKLRLCGIAEEQTRIRRFIVELERKNEQQANRIRLLKEREAASRGGISFAPETAAARTR